MLEYNCSLARTCLKHARIAFKRLFGHFFPGDSAPDNFEPLAKAFLGKEDPALDYRRVVLKIGVESTIALVIASGEAINWSKVGAKKYSKDAMTGFLKSAKKYS